METRNIPNVIINITSKNGFDDFNLYIYLDKEEEELLKGRSTALKNVLRDTLTTSLDKMILRPFVEKIYGKVDTSFDYERERLKELSQLEAKK